MLPKIRVQCRRIALHNMLDEASVRPKQYAPKSKGQGAKGKPRGCGQLDRTKEARNVEQKLQTL